MPFERLLIMVPTAADPADLEVIDGQIFAPTEATRRAESSLPNATTFSAVILAQLDQRDAISSAWSTYRVEGRSLAAGDASTFLFAPVFRARHLDAAAFDAHWRDVHGPIALRHHAGMTAYEQHTVVEVISGPPFDGIAQLGFPSIAAFEERFFDSDEGRRIVGEDTARFIDVARWETLLTQRR